VYRLAIIGVVVLLAAVTLMFLRGPEAWQRQYYQMEYREVIDAVAVRQEVNPFLIASVIDAESDWEPNALSSVGAVGLMQVMPSTAEELAERGLVDAKRFPAEDLHVPGVNIEYGAAYLRYLVERYHEVETALAAYNAGLANVDQWAARGGDIRAQIEFPATRHFVLKVVRGKDRYEALYPDSFTDWSSR
jgi:soluble lytic murein transglycosylase